MKFNFYLRKLTYASSLIIILVAIKQGLDSPWI